MCEKKKKKKNWTRDRGTHQLQPSGGECSMVMTSHKLEERGDENKIYIYFYFLFLNLSSSHFETDHIFIILCTKMGNRIIKVAFLISLPLRL